jgi:hypothetical protein
MVIMAIIPLALKHNSVSKSQFLLERLVKWWVRGEAVTEELNYNKAGQPYCIPQVTDWERKKYSEKNLSQCRFVHHKSDMECPGIEPGLSW